MARRGELAPLRETAERFSALLYGMMLEQMDKTIPRTGLLDGGRVEEIFRSFLYDEYAEMAASEAGASNPITLAVFEMLYENHSAGRPMPRVPTFLGLG